MFLGTSAPTLLYWAQIAPSSRGVFAVGALALLLTAAAALDALGTTLYTRALRAGGPRSGVGLAVLLIGPLLGAPLAIPLCLVAAGLSAFLEDLTGVPAGALAAACACGAAVLLALVVARERRRRPRAPGVSTSPAAPRRFYSCWRLWSCSCCWRSARCAPPSPT
jgi:hypothetical protein